MEEEKKVSKGIWQQMRENGTVTIFDMNKYKNMTLEEFKEAFLKGFYSDKLPSEKKK